MDAIPETEDHGGKPDDDSAIMRCASVSDITNSSVAPSGQNSYSFSKWIKSIRRSRGTNFTGPSNWVMGWPDDEALDESYSMFPNFNEPENHADNASVASSSLLHRVKTASLSQISLSLFNRPRTNTQTSTQRSACHSSGFSGSDARRSMDSNRLASTLSLDEGAWNRAVQRRQIIKEFLDTETTYVSGLKALADVLSTMFVSRTGLQRSAGELLRLHDGFLASLQSAIHRSNSNGSIGVSKWAPGRRRTKKNSLDIHFGKPDRKTVTSRRLRESVDSRIKSSRLIAAEPSEAADVAKILMARLPKFVAYQDYGIKYQLVPKEVEELRKSINWQLYDQGIEALFRSVAPLNCREKHPNQALTLNDLLVKPIQRVCKYQLFLSDLLKHTPASDCPSSHSTIERAHQRMISVVQDINRATGDPIAKDRTEKTILLQGKLEFPPALGGDRDVLRDFGTLRTCGVLHVAYQTTELVTGEYMMCALFPSHLLLATPCNEGRKFIAAFIIRASDMRFETGDNATGLNCQKIPFSFKLIYGTIGNTFELIFSACSAKEKAQWKDQILEQLDPVGEPTSPRDLTMTSLALKPLPETTASDGAEESDRITLRIKGIEAMQRSNQASNSSLGRQQPTQKNLGNTIVLSPKRQDRIRMERWISSIWTCDVISYPGMAAGKGEYFIRSSAESFIRRLSSRRPFTRRSSSLATINTIKSVDAKRASKVDLSLDEKDTAEWAGSDVQEDKMVLDGDSFKTADETMSSSPEYATETPSPNINQRAKGNVALDRDTKSSKKKKWSVSLFKTMSPVKPRRSWPVEA